jgi:predicted nucleotidyltransferase
VTDFARLIRTLTGGEVAFILVGGVAATVHGSARLTRDVDVVYARDPGNIERLAATLGPFHPRLRGAPAGLPFTLDAQTIAAGLNFTLTTDAGDLDLLGEITGSGTYEALVKDAMTITIFGQSCRCLTLDQLIAAKRAAGRPRDLEAVAELEMIRDRIEAQ